MGDLYQALMNRDKDRVLKMYKDEVLKMYKEHQQCEVPLTTHHDTVLHIAAFSKQEDLLTEILKNESHIKQILTEVNSFGDTVLHEAMSTDMTTVVDMMLEAVPNLLTKQNKNGETPLFKAVQFGQTKTLKHVTERFRDSSNKEIHWRRKDDATILHVAILNESFETALELLNLNLTFVKHQDVDGCGLTCLQLLANMPLAFKSGTRFGLLRKLVYYCLPDSKRDEAPKSCSVPRDEEAAISEPTAAKFHARVISQLRIFSSKLNNKFWCCLSQGWPAIQMVWDLKKKHASALKLVKILVESDKSWMVPSQHHGMHPGDVSIFRDGFPKLSSNGELYDDSQSEDSQDDHYKEIPLHAATRHGIIEIVEVILEEYPQAIEYVNDQDANALHIAVRNRRSKVYEVLVPFIQCLPRLMMRMDCNGNSLLHQVAVLGDFQPKERPGEALHMQWEIQWFKKVKKIVPHYFLNHLNNQRLTSQELFTENRRELVVKGQEWIMRTSESCSVVAALIATVAFTSAYTVPGGTDSGKPVFLNKRPFMVFTIADAMSLSLSLTSLVIFLSIMTARFDELDFHHSLPARLVLGLTTLFLAVSSMMVAFAATLVLMIRQKLHWAAIPIYLVACYPVTIFLALQFPLYVRVAWYTIKDLARTTRCSFRN
ncbi:Ankyrin repeat-containing protein [Thalictrum thalictroides]|uniref:Ankyrin repeat-containing protein n=1 Tax=Thalictrum thalictroides TaxID=46969 RepID=A0A7J6VPF7_THATH|nr:Ankyrin repeat-containing protein [Thalictrum thalictroides]